MIIRSLFFSLGVMPYPPPHFAAHGESCTKNGFRMEEASASRFLTNVNNYPSMAGRACRRAT